MRELKGGLYDQLITERIRRTLQSQSSTGLKSLTATLEEGDCPEYLARHLIRQMKAALRGLPAEDRRRRQLELANSLLDFVRSHGEDLIELDPIDPSGEILRALYRGAAPPEPPSTPLSVTSLLMNAVDEPRLGFEREREMATADRVLMVVSFIQWRGWQRLKSAFHELAGREVPIRLLTTTYIGATDFRAIQELCRLPNVEMKISLDGRRRRLHAKAWLLQRDNGFSSVYVGSANLSGPALEDGIEWTVKLSEVEAPHIVERFRGAFDSLWCDDEFELFQPDDEDCCQRVKLYETQSTDKRHTAVITLSFDANNSLQITWQKLAFSMVDLGETDQILTVSVECTPLYDSSNGVISAVAKCGVDGICQ